MNDYHVHLTDSSAKTASLIHVSLHLQEWLIPGKLSSQGSHVSRASNHEQIHARGRLLSNVLTNYAGYFKLIRVVAVVCVVNLLD